MGWLLAVGIMTGAFATLATLATGEKWCINWYRIPPKTVVLALVLLFLAAWGYKIVDTQTAAGVDGRRATASWHG